MLLLLMFARIVSNLCRQGHDLHVRPLIEGSHRAYGKSQTEFNTSCRSQIFVFTLVPGSVFRLRSFRHLCGVFICFVFRKLQAHQFAVQLFSDTLEGEVMGVQSLVQSARSGTYTCAL